MNKCQCLLLDDSDVRSHEGSDIVLDAIADAEMLASEVVVFRGLVVKNRLGDAKGSSEFVFLHNANMLAPAEFARHLS